MARVRRMPLLLLALAALWLLQAAPVALRGEGLPLWGLVGLKGGLAALIGVRTFGLARWWIALQLALLPAVAGGFALGLPGWAWLAAFAALLALYWNSFRGRVPLYLSGRVA